MSRPASSSVNFPITVITPVFNGERFIARTLDSILAQTFREFRLLVIDNASTDGTRLVLDGYTDSRLRVLRCETNVGPAGARNMGLDCAESRFVAFCDADDVWEPQRLERQLDFLRFHDDVQLLGSRMTFIDEHDRPIGASWNYERNDLLGPAMLFGNCFATSTLVLSRALVGDDRFDQRLCPVEDYDLWARLIQRGGAHILPEMLVRYRVHGGATTRALHENTQRSLETIAQKQLQRLGIAATPADLRLHVALGLRKIGGTTLAVSETAAWLEKIWRANALSGTYRPDLLDSVLARQWLHVCDAAAQGGCLDAWPRIVRSRFTARLMSHRTSRRELGRLPWRTARGLIRHHWPAIGRLRRALRFAPSSRGR